MKHHAILFQLTFIFLLLFIFLHLFTFLPIYIYIFTYLSLLTFIFLFQLTIPLHLDEGVGQIAVYNHLGFSICCLNSWKTIIIIIQIFANSISHSDAWLPPLTTLHLHPWERGKHIFHSFRCLQIQLAINDAQLQKNSSSGYPAVYFFRLMTVDNILQSLLFVKHSIVRDLKKPGPQKIPKWEMIMNIFVLYVGLISVIPWIPVVWEIWP